MIKNVKNEKVKDDIVCGAKHGESWQEDVAKAENYLHSARTGELMVAK